MRAAACPCSAEDADLEIRDLPLDYDHCAAAAAMRAANLPDGYAEAVSSGLWLSLDVGV